MKPAVYKHYLLGVLTAILTFNYVDRLALGVLLQDIKIDLHVTDTQLGLLSGIAFALFYSVMGVPIARWADRGNRITIITLTCVLWSAAVALCGFAGSFIQLLLIRIGVAVGEAGCIPPAFALIADYFPRAERPRATAIYGMGGGIACVIGYFLAGWLDQLYGWRITFLLLAIPGLVLGAVARLTLKEPREDKRYAETPTSLSIQPSFRTVVVTLWGNVTFRHLLSCLAVSFFFTYGILQWQPTFLIRSYGLTTGEAGTWLAVIYGVSTFAGAYLGGGLATRFAPNNETLQLRGMSVAVVCASVFFVLVYLSPNKYWAFLWLGLASTGQSTLSGPLFSTIQTLVPGEMRAVTFALVYLVANLVGMGFGPLAAGFLSDMLRPWVGQESVRYASLMLAPGYLWVAWHSWRASQTVACDLATESLKERVGATDRAPLNVASQYRAAR